MPTRRSRKKAKPKKVEKRLFRDREAWIAEARTVLVNGGIASVKVGKLATKLGVTRESFYWHFKNLEELLDSLLADWKKGNAEAYKALVECTAPISQKFDMLFEMWVREDRYSPAWDAAIRDWARTSKKADRVLRQVDEDRIEMIHQMFLDLGHEATEALVRARICYFHQVGYYTIKPGEPRTERLRLVPVYQRILKGRG